MQNAKLIVGRWLNMNENAIEIKSFEFAVRIVNLYKHLTEEKREFVMSK